MGDGAMVVTGGTVALATMESAPDVVLAEAGQAARALQSVIAGKPKKVVMNGEQYLEFEDWQTVGRFYGVTAKEDGDPELVRTGEYDDQDREVRGFKASAVAIDRNGHVLSRATAYCLSDEEKWSSRAKYAYVYATRSGGWSVEDPGKDEIVWEPNPATGKNRPKKERRLVGEERVPLFQMASMAQTRAAAKVLRNVLSWVVVMAGYRPTPAEELDAPPQPNTPTPVRTAEDIVDAEPTTANGQPLAPESERVRAAGAEPNPSYAGDATCPKGHEGCKPWKGARAGKPETHFCSTCKQPFAPARVAA